MYYFKFVFCLILFNVKKVFKSNYVNKIKIFPYNTSNVDYNYNNIYSVTFLSLFKPLLNYKFYPKENSKIFNSFNNLIFYISNKS